MVYVYMIGTYNKYIKQQQPVGSIIKNNIILAWMKMINPAIGWFEIVKVPTFDLDEVTGVNDEHIDELSERLRRLFNNTWLYRYPHPRNVLFDKRILF